MIINRSIAYQGERGFIHGFAVIIYSPAGADDIPLLSQRIKKEAYREGMLLFWRRRRDSCTRSRIVEMRTKHSSVSFLLALCFPSLKTTIQVVFTSSLLRFATHNFAYPLRLSLSLCLSRGSVISRRLTNAVKVQIRHRQKKKTIAPRKVVL